MSRTNVTRGHGLLEGFLARQRIRQARRLIGADRSRGRVLDIGCGSFPLFLVSTDFAEKYGLDRLAVGAPDQARAHHLRLIQHDVGSRKPLPFAAEFFDVVTMLAVFEHIELDALGDLLSEVHRVLRPGGIYVMTTPAFWTDGLLKMLATIGFVSHQEVDEHKGSYRHSEISSVLTKAGFPRDRIRLGYFEAGMNVWATAAK